VPGPYGAACPAWLIRMGYGSGASTGQDRTNAKDPGSYHYPDPSHYRIPVKKGLSAGRPLPGGNTELADLDMIGMLLFVGQGATWPMSKAARNYPGRNEVRVGRVGVIIPVLVVCGLLVPACSRGSSAAPERPNPVRVTTETVSTGWYTQIFDTNLAADPAQASVIEGFRAGLILWNKSQETMKLVAPVTAYVTGAALSALKATLVREKTQDVVIGGTDRLFKTRVTVISGTNATITTCDDGSKFEEVNPSTGVPDPAYIAPANQQYLFETWQMTRLDGRWAISAVSPVTLPDSRAKPCQPLPALNTASTRSYWLALSLVDGVVIHWAGRWLVSQVPLAAR
jgi:hypothetical protein